jgi:GT2 family glycosyltransferase
VRRSVLEQVGDFDEEFFFIFEDIDLSWRVRLAGYKIMLCPRSVVYHYTHGSWSQPDIRKRIFYSIEGRKNLLRMLTKNMSFRKLLAALPQAIGFNLIQSVYTMNTVGIYGLVRAILWNLRNLSDTWKQRGKIQYELRRLSDKKIFNYWVEI